MPATLGMAAPDGRAGQDPDGELHSSPSVLQQGTQSQVPHASTHVNSANLPRLGSRPVPEQVRVLFPCQLFPIVFPLESNCTTSMYREYFLAELACLMDTLATRTTTLVCKELFLHPNRRKAGFILPERSVISTKLSRSCGRVKRMWTSATSCAKTIQLTSRTRTVLQETG